MYAGATYAGGTTGAGAPKPKPTEKRGAAKRDPPAKISPAISLLFIFILLITLALSARRLPSCWRLKIRGIWQAARWKAASVGGAWYNLPNENSGTVVGCVVVSRCTEFSDEIFCRRGVDPSDAGGAGAWESHVARDRSAVFNPDRSVRSYFEIGHRGQSESAR